MFNLIKYHSKLLCFAVLLQFPVSWVWSQNAMDDEQNTCFFLIYLEPKLHKINKL